MKLRIVVSLLALAALLVGTSAAPAQEAKPETAKAARLALDDILTLLAGGVTPARVATLVKERGVDFALTPENENKLRIAGADDSLLLAIAKAPPPTERKPEPEPVKPPPPPAPVDKARAALDNAIKGIGGLAALENISDATVVLQSTVAGPSGEIAATVKVYWLRPDKLRNDIQTQSGVFTLVWDGPGGWSRWQEAVQDLTPSQLENGRRVVAHLLEFLLVEAHRGQRRTESVEGVLLEGRECDVIVVTDSKGDAVKLYVEKASGRILRRESQALSDTGAVVQVVEMYYDFRPAGAFVLPFREVTWQDGRKLRESVVESYQFDTFVDPSLFARPAAAPARKQPSRRK